MIIYPIEGVYSDKTPIDVSIVVPLYKSRCVIQDQIRFWPYEPNIRAEIIYVDDRCPQKSKQVIFKTWKERSDRHNFLVKLILAEKNLGFGGACNLGAYHARGEYLIFLNADATATPGWLGHILKPFSDPQVGIVGNLQIKEGGEHHGTIDGAGSEWSWKELSFVHIGRHIHQGKTLNLPLHPFEAPADIMSVGEREMVTGCCFAIPKNLFDELGGFNFNYRRGYWEDSELNMSVREKGYKIMFTPHSIVYHKLSHSNIAQHDWQQANRSYFLNKWVESGRIDALVKDKRPIRPTRISNILLIRSSANGDVLMASSVAAALKKKYPDSKVHMLTECPGIVQNNIHIDELVTWESHQSNLYQLVVDLDGCYERRPFTNILDAYADEAGVPVSDCKLYIHTAKFEVPKSRYVALHCGATNWVGRHLKAEIFENIAIRLQKLGYTVVCVGNGGDKSIAEAHVDYVGQTSIFEMATIIKKADLFIGIDSMPMHVAQAVKTPGVVFFGSIDPKSRIINSNMVGVTVPDLPCLGCHHRRPAPSVVTNVCQTGTLDCEEKITVETIWQKVLPMLQKGE